MSAEQIPMKYQSYLLKELILDPSNVRSHDRKNIEAIKGSLLKFGQQKPIVITKDKVVVAGNGTLEAARELKWETINTVETSLTGTELTGYAIADNRTGELAVWDDESLSKTLKSLQMADFDLNSIGFSDKDLKDLITEDAREADGTEDHVPEVIDSISKPGDLWILGEHRLLCGNSSELPQVKLVLAGNLADICITDPPYGVSYEKKMVTIENVCTRKAISSKRATSNIAFDHFGEDELIEIIERVFKNINEILASKSCYYIFAPMGGNLGLKFLNAAKEANIPNRHILLWRKNRAVFSMNRLDYDYQHEAILFGWSPNRTHYPSTREGIYNTSVWDCPFENNELHPTMKPVTLIENALQNHCPKNGIVFDPFLGSGSTLIACEKNNRRCFGLEIDPHYCDVIITRWQEYTGKKASLELI